MSSQCGICVDQFTKKLFLAVDAPVCHFEMDELNEIKDLVARTLEKKNVLSKLRVKLRF